MADLEDVFIQPRLRIFSELYEGRTGVRRLAQPVDTRLVEDGVWQGQMQCERGLNFFAEFTFGEPGEETTLKLDLPVQRWEKPWLNCDVEAINLAGLKTGEVGTSTQKVSCEGNIDSRVRIKGRVRAAARCVEAELSEARFDRGRRAGVDERRRW